MFSFDLDLEDPGRLPQVKGNKKISFTKTRENLDFHFFILFGLPNIIMLSNL